MKEQTEYEIEKQKNKQKLVRNEFLYYNLVLHLVKLLHNLQLIFLT